MSVGSIFSKYPIFSRNNKNVFFFFLQISFSADILLSDVFIYLEHVEKQKKLLHRFIDAETVKSMKTF